MKQTLQAYFIILTFTLLYACNRQHKHYVKLVGFSDKNEVVYEIKAIKFIFSKNSLINYCNKKILSERNNFSYRQVIDYLKKRQENSIVISDTLGTELVIDSTINLNSRDSLHIRIRNQKSDYAFVTDALDWTLLDLIQDGEIKIYDKKANKFVKYVFFEEVNKSSYGEDRISLPNGAIVFAKMTWIQ